MSADFAEHCTEHGVRRQLTAPYTPQQNGVVGTACSMLKAKGLPGQFWAEAVATTVYVLNRSPTKSVEDKMPFEAWYGKKPAVHHLRTFGCVVHVKLTTPNMKKPDDRSKPMIFIGYEHGSKAYRAYDPTTKRAHVTRDAVFDEQARWDWGADSKQNLDTFAVEEYITVIRAAPADQDAVEALGGGTPARSPSPPLSPHSVADGSGGGAQAVEFATPPSRVDSSTLDADHDDNVPLRFRRMDNILGETSPRGLAPRVLAGELHAVSSDDPFSFADAEHDPSWRKAMLEEMKSIEENHTWSLADLPPEGVVQSVSSVFKVKWDEHGAVAKHKARLVVKGYA